MFINKSNDSKKCDSQFSMFSAQKKIPHKKICIHSRLFFLFKATIQQTMGISDFRLKLIKFYFIIDSVILR